MCISKEVCGTEKVHACPAFVCAAQSQDKGSKVCAPLQSIANQACPCWKVNQAEKTQDRTSEKGAIVQEFPVQFHIGDSTAC